MLIAWPNSTLTEPYSSSTRTYEGMLDIKALMSGNSRE